MRRKSSRRFRHLRSKQARTIAVREPNAAANSVGAKRAVTSAVRGGWGARARAVQRARVVSFILIRVDPLPPGSWHRTAPFGRLRRLEALTAGRSNLHDHSDHLSRACAMNLHTNDPTVLPGGSLGDSTMTKAHRRCDCCSRRPRTTGSSTSHSRRPSRWARAAVVSEHRALGRADGHGAPLPTRRVASERPCPPKRALSDPFVSGATGCADETMWSYMCCEILVLTVPCARYIHTCSDDWPP